MTRSPRMTLGVIGTIGIVTLSSAGCGSSGSGGSGGGGGGPTPPTSVTPTLSSVSLSSTSVAGGTSVQGTATLNSPPSSAATVTLASSNAAATVPGNVTVNAGATSGTFNVSTSAVSSSTSATISASFNGATQTATLTVTPPPLTANFTVTSLSPAIRRLPTDPPGGVVILPAGSPDVCPLISAPGSGSQVLDCRLDGAASTPSASIQRYLWRYLFGPFVREEESAGPQYKPAESGCGFFGGRSPSSSGGVQFLQLIVELRVRDNSGTVSAIRSNPNVRIFPAGLCGYGF